MKRFVNCLSLLGVLAFAIISAQAQSGSIGGTVHDATGSVVPGVAVVVRGEAGQEFRAITGSNGTYVVPNVATGTYSVTFTGQGFKTLVAQNVKVDVGTPATVNGVLEVGGVDEEVIVTTGAEVLQTGSPKVGSTIQGRQILETPQASRDALDLVALLPGTATVGRPRSASINGLPKGAISITIDGVDVQDQTLRSNDGFFTYVRPRIDAIDEVSVSTANAGADSGADGAVQIQFATRRGTNDYAGSLFWQHRNTALNANYWYNNRDGLARQRIILNQFGGRLGGPIPFLNFGDDGGPFFKLYKDRAFFFVNYEEFHNPNALTRTRTVLNPHILSGDFQYMSGGAVQTVNLFNIANQNGELATIDPTISSVLNRIQTSTNGQGTFIPITNNPNRSQFSFTNTGKDLRKFLTMRFDVNITKDHAVEYIHNRQNFVPSVDFLNSRDPIFPGFPYYGQGGIRKSHTGALRSSFGTNVVNQFRFAHSGGFTDFFNTISPADFDFSQGYFLSFAAAGVTSPYNNNNRQGRGTPNYDITNNTTWIAGNHSIQFGGSHKLIKSDSYNQNIAPTVGFGVHTSENTAYNMFVACGGGAPAWCMPGATTAQVNEARDMYAFLVGRVISLSASGVLESNGQYAAMGNNVQKFSQKIYGLYAQDTWRITPNFQLSFGLRWQPYEAFTIQSGNVGKLEHPDQIWGLSGPGNIFKPGVLQGTQPRYTLYKIGEKAYSDDFNNWAPSFGFVWSPTFGNGFLGSLFGSNGTSVFRGGYSRAFVREGFSLQTTVAANVPGGSISLSRTTGIGNITTGTNLRTPNNPNLTYPAFNATPNVPTELTIANNAMVVDPALQTGYVDSFSFGYQRQLDRNSVLEVSYVANRGNKLHRTNWVNEINSIENNFAQEFMLAQQNLYANMAAGRGANFRHYPGMGTSPLPTFVAYFNAGGADPNSAAAYTSSLFANATLLSYLSNLNPNVLTMANQLYADAGRRANAAANNIAINHFRVNPTVASAFMLSSDAKSWYDSMQVQFRRRLTNGLRVQANYTWAKAQSNAFASSSTQQSNYSLRPEGLINAKNVQVFDLRHSFKLDATYDLPIGTGRWLFTDAGRVANFIIGGWSVMPTFRWQSGSPFSFGNVALVGMTADELQKEIKVRKDSIVDGQNVVTFLPVDIIENTRRAYNINVTSATGYGTTYGGPPTGRYIAPAGTGNCVSRFNSECGFANLILYGPDFMMVDTSVRKQFRIDEKRNFEFRATFLDLLNKPPFRIGGFGADVIAAGVGGSTFGQMGSGSAYQDVSTTNNPGGRMIDLMIRINF